MPMLNNNSQLKSNAEKVIHEILKQMVQLAYCFSHAHIHNFEHGRNVRKKICFSDHEEQGYCTLKSKNLA